MVIETGMIIVLLMFLFYPPSAIKRGVSFSWDKTGLINLGFELHFLAHKKRCEEVEIGFFNSFFIVFCYSKLN